MPLVLQPSWTGRRVTVRRRVPGLENRYADVVGDLVALGAHTAVVHTRTGPVEVPLAEVALARVAPPSTADELELEGIMAAGWRAAESEPLGGWLLRATGGFTARANSVLPLRAPGRPLDEALDAVRRWYRARGLPVRFQVPTEARRLLDAELRERGWQAQGPVHVLAARLELLAGAPAHPVTITATPDDGWLARFRGGRGTEPAARGILGRHAQVAFAAVHQDGRTVAIGRGTVDSGGTPAGAGVAGGGGWLGVTCVEVAETCRRQGLARAIMAALHDWGRVHGAERAHLEVSADNAAALALYGSLGYWTHHDYHYRHDPAA
jgi:GNAT superfamily N-acetyltransferase